MSKRKYTEQQAARIVALAGARRAAAALPVPDGLDHAQLVELGGEFGLEQAEIDRAARDVECDSEVTPAWGFVGLFAAMALLGLAGATVLFAYGRMVGFVFVGVGLVYGSGLVWSLRERRRETVRIGGVIGV